LDDRDYFDYIRRTMPCHAAGEPSDYDVYALTACVLAKSWIIRDNEVLDRARLPRV